MSKLTNVNELFEGRHFDRETIQHLTRSMLGFKTFGCARILLAGIEVMHMIRKSQPGDVKDRVWSAANQFYSLAL